MACHVGEDHIAVTAAEGSDLWRVTSYGFVHDSGHARLGPLAVGSAVEVGFVADFDRQFDQAGVLVRADEQTWIKAGLEVVDGVLHLGAVVTRGASDWSLHPVPAWAGRVVTLRASRSADAVTVRARVAGGRWQLVRLAPFPDVEAEAGPLVCAPTRAGLTVRFTRFATGAADGTLHGG